MERYYFEKQRKCKKKAFSDHPIIGKSQIYVLNKFTSKDLNLILVEANTAKLTPQDYFENHFKIFQFNWKKSIFSNS